MRQEPASLQSSTQLPTQGGASVRLLGVVHLYRRAGGDVVALRGVDLDIEPGEMVALLGPSGMGKTTVLRLMAGLIQASAGIVMVGGRDLGRLTAAERRALRAGEISHIVQGTSPNVLLFATAMENVWFSQHAARSRGHSPPWEPEELLGMLGLEELASERTGGVAAWASATNCRRRGRRFRFSSLVGRRADVAALTRCEHRCRSSSPAHQRGVRHHGGDRHA